MTRDARDAVLARLRQAAVQLEETMHADLIPDAGANLSYAIPEARSRDDVAAVEGMIVRSGNRPHLEGSVAFGVNDHLATIVLTAMKYDADIRSAAIIRYSPSIIGIIEDLFLEICSFDRAHEPPGIQTMDWGVAFCCRNGVPDIIFDRGAPGKEPIVRVLAEDPGTVVTIIGRIGTRMEKVSSR